MQKLLQIETKRQTQEEMENPRAYHLINISLLLFFITDLDKDDEFYYEVTHQPIP
jgi:hypothetical protein